MPPLIDHNVAELRLLAAGIADLWSAVSVAIERAEGGLHTLPTVTLYGGSPKISARARETPRVSGAKSDSLRCVCARQNPRYEHRAGGH